MRRMNWEKEPCPVALIRFCAICSAEKASWFLDKDFMKIMFTVQGDGRGHMTQAIAASQTLERQGHEIVAVTVGTNPNRMLPEFFRKAFGDRIRPIASPGFVFQGARGVAPLATACQVLSGL